MFVGASSVLGLNNGGPSTGRQGALWPAGTGHSAGQRAPPGDGSLLFAPRMCCQGGGFNELSSLSRITDQRYEKVPYFVFGDFNFRLDSKRVIEVSFHVGTGVGQVLNFSSPPFLPARSPSPPPPPLFSGCK